MDKSLDLVSIIIPTYNRKLYLLEAVQSCIKQSYENLEVIIVDDGSSDGTDNRVQGLLANKWKEYNIRYYKQSNSGASAARNLGLSLAQGDYIQFLDSDDVLFENKIESQLKFIKANNLEGCSCYGYMGDELDNKNNLATIGKSFATINELLEELCNGVHVMQTSAPLWKTKLLQKTKGWDGQLGFGDDLEYHIRVLLKANQFKFLNEHLFYLRVHQQDRLSDASSDIKAILSGIETQKKIVGLLKNENKLSAKIKEGISKSCRTLYVNLLKSTNKKHLKEFEAWLLRDLKIESWFFKVLINFRKVFGNRMLWLILQLILKLKA